MRMYSRKVGSDARIQYGTELAAGLVNFPEAMSLAGPLEELNDRLEAALADRISREKPVRRARSSVRVCDYRVDAAIRSIDAAARIADGGGKGGPIHRTLFPEGLSAVVEPTGASQIPATRTLLDRMNTSLRPGVAAFRDEWLGRLTEALGYLETTVAELERALRAEREAFLLECALREEHALEIERIMGRVRTLYPGDRARQDAIFPPVRRAKRRAEAGGQSGSSDTVAA